MGNSQRGYEGMNRGDWQPNLGGARAPEQQFGAATAHSYSQGLRDMRQLRQQLPDGSETREEVDRIIKEMQQLDPSRFAGNPALVEKMHREILPMIEQLELKLRRELDDQGGAARAGASDRIPPGYSTAVAEYFRKLGRAKPQ